MDLHYNLILSFVLRCVGLVGVLVAVALAIVESTLKYHPVYDGALTWVHYLDQEQCQAGSLTGAVAS